MHRRLDSIPTHQPWDLLKQQQKLDKVDMSCCYSHFPKYRSRRLDGSSAALFWTHTPNIHSAYECSYLKTPPSLCLALSRADLNTSAECSPAELLLLQMKQ